MKLVFYKVNNSKNYDRHSFDAIYDQPEVIKEMLSELSDEELSIYNMDDKYDADCFADSFNNEELSSGWWCIILRD